MKKLIIPLLAATTLTVGLAGCVVTQPADNGNWEYKTVEAPDGAQDALISRLAKEGWTIIAFSATEGQPNVILYHYVLRRRAQ